MANSEIEIFVPFFRQNKNAGDINAYKLTSAVTSIWLKFTLDVYAIGINRGDRNEDELERLHQLWHGVFPC